MPTPGPHRWAGRSRPASAPAAARQQAGLRVAGKKTASGEAHELVQDVKEALGLSASASIVEQDAEAFSANRPLGAWMRDPSRSAAERLLPSSAETTSASVGNPGSATPSGVGLGAASTDASEAAVGSSSSLLKSRRSSKVRLHEHRLKQDARDRARNAESEHRESETTYRILRHMSEANVWAEELGISTRFRPHRPRRAHSTNGTGKVVCHVYEDEKFSKEVPLKSFERRYTALQSRYNMLALAKAGREQKQGMAALTVSADTFGLKQESRDHGSKPLTSLLSREAQEALQSHIRRVTLETLALADRMRQQLDVLEKEAKPLNPFVIH